MDTSHKSRSASPSPSSGRGGLLTVALTGLAAAGILFFMILVTGGFFFNVVLIVAAIVGLGFFHYMLWGYTMTAEEMEDREESRRRSCDAAAETGPSTDNTKRFNSDWTGPETRIK